MVCPNCKSTDIISVQDEFFCIACGQTVPKPPGAKAGPVAATVTPDDLKAAIARDQPLPVKSDMAATPVPTPTPAPAPPTPPPPPEAEPPKPEPPTELAKSEPPPTVPASDPEPEPAPAVAAGSPLIIKRRKPGRPKAGRLDVPLATPVAPAPVASVTPAKPAAPAIRPSSVPRRILTDIAPPVPIIGSPGQPTPAADQPPVPSPVRPGSSLHLTLLAGASLHERIRPAVFGWSLLPAAFLAVIISAGITVLVRGHVSDVWQATQQAGWVVWGELLLILGLYYLSHSLVSAALTYGAARRTDHRPVPPARQFAAAVNSFGPRLGLDTILTITQAGVIALGALLLLSGHQAWPLPELGRYAAVFVAFAALTYVMVGLILIQNLGRVGLGLAEIRVVQQLAISWRLFRRHFELVGFRALCLLLELMLLVPFIAAAATLLIMTPPSLTWVVALGLMVLATTAGALLGGGTAAWWETAYRHLIQSDYPSDTGSLLSGRAAGKPQPFALAVTAGLAGILIVAAVAWPWLSLYI